MLTVRGDISNKTTNKTFQVNVIPEKQHKRSHFGSLTSAESEAGRSYGEYDLRLVHLSTGGLNSNQLCML